ncbi:MAG: Na-translocating system protein MpsB [Planctomycetota bacterium]|nr:Na-translocating system protein MpsB [Planctomycetota bacterium]
MPHFPSSLAMTGYHPAAATDHPVATPAELEQVTAAINTVTALIPPLWPLEDYVAVNPFLGFAPRRFLEGRQILRDVRDCELLLPAAYYRDLFDRWEIAVTDVEQAFEQCVELYPDLYSGSSSQPLMQQLAEAAVAERSTGPVDGGSTSERRYSTVSEVIDRRLGSSWSSHVITDISRHCGLHYDRGQAAWGSPWKHLPLYEAWREAFRISRRMDMLGLRGFRRFVAGLPVEPDQAVASLLGRLAVPTEHWQPFLHCELSSIAGWASFLRYRLWQATLTDGCTMDEHLVGLTAIRLAYDAVLAATYPGLIAAEGSLCPADGPGPGEAAPSAAVLARHFFQVAAEVAYRRRPSSSRRGRGRPASISVAAPSCTAMTLPATRKARCWS